MWRAVGDLRRVAEEAVIGLAAGDNLILRESLTRKAADLRDELGKEGESLVERLLIDRVVVGWLSVHYHDAVLALNANAHGPRAEQCRKRLDAANGRFLQSVKQLAVVRKLLGSTTASRPSPRTRSGNRPGA